MSGLLSAADRALPLGAKFIVPLIVLAVIVVGAVVWVEYQVERAEITERYKEESEILARSLAADLREEGHTQHLADGADLEKHIAKVLSLDPAALRASIYVAGPAGAIRAGSSEPSLVGQSAGFEDAMPLYTGATTTRETELATEKALEVLAPVEVNGEIVASLGVYVSLAERDAAVRAIALRLMGAAALAVVLLAGSISLAVHILVVRRLRRMTAAGDALARGDMTSRVAGHWGGPGRDEMAQAIRRFNKMAESVQALTTKLEHLGVTDALTGICNRRFFDEVLSREVDRGRRLGVPLALLMLDIDGFKGFNDRFGHPAGDEALRRVARALVRELRPMVSFARYGGEEFAAILPGASRDLALSAAERLRSATESITFGVNGEQLTVSVGVAAYPDDALNAAELVAAADTALYAAKQAGRNAVRAAGSVDFTLTPR